MSVEVGWALFRECYEVARALCAGENLVSKSSRQVEAVTGGGAGEDKDGGARTAHRVGPRHVVLAIRSPRFPTVAGRDGTRQRADGGAPLQSPGRRNGLPGRTADLRRLPAVRQRRRSRFPPLNEVTLLLIYSFKSRSAF